MRYTHENGYSAELYGTSSMSIYSPDGTECLHTGSRSVKTEREVMEILEWMLIERQALAELIKTNEDLGGDI